MATNRCPRAHILRLFCDGNLSVSRVEEVGQHLGECGKCLSEVEQLQHAQNGENELIGSLRHAMKNDQTDSILSRAEEDAIIASVDYVEVVSNSAIHGQEIFQCYGEIGQGPFGSVVLATDEHQKKIAIKLPFRHQVASREHWKQFLRDAKTSNELQHPSILPVRQFGMWDERRTFLTMPLVNSPNLTKFLTANRVLPIELARMIFHNVGNAIHFAHTQSTPVLHRHLNPNNIFVRSRKQIQVGDFGFTFDTRYQFGLVDPKAKPCPFVSPECRSLDEEKVDQRADIYSLGTLLALLMSRVKDISRAESCHNRHLAIQCRSPIPCQRPETVAELLESAIL